MLRESRLKFMTTDFYRTPDTAGDEITFFQTITYLLLSKPPISPFLPLCGGPSLLFHQGKSSTHKLLGEQDFLQVPATTLATHAAFLLSVTLDEPSGRLHKVFLLFRPQVLCLVAFPKVASTPLPSLSYILLFLSLPDQCNPQSPV